MTQEEEVKKIEDVLSESLPYTNPVHLHPLALVLYDAGCRLSPPPVVGDLREQLAEWFFDDYSKVELGGSCGWGDYKDLPEDDKNAWRNKADSILSIIKEAGLVKLNKDQIQLSDTDEVIIDKVGLDPFAVRGMVKAGWRKIA